MTAAPEPRLLRVRTGASGSYPVLVGPGLLSRLAGDLARGRLGPRGAPPARVAIVSDSRVARLYGRDLLRRLIRAGLRADLVVFPAGEVHKTRETKARLEDGLARSGFGRDGLVVALGGGVTGDLAGFLAATWHRGVPVIQAPTTLIAMLDASIGGKVGVDHPLAKNLVGAFHPPLAVYADTATLATLPEREYRQGLAEAVKCGVIADASLFRFLEVAVGDLMRRETSTVLKTIERSMAVKVRIVSRDERETGPRMLLNFGHTLGHALEAASGYRLRHGEAVALGMVLESRLAVRMGLLDGADALRIEVLLAGLRLRIRSSAGKLSTGAVLAAAGRDKKSRAGQVRYVLPSRIGLHAGGSDYALPVAERLVERVVRGFLAGLE